MSSHALCDQENRQTGYAPACANELVPGVCELPRIKCGECPNQAFIPVADEAILDHLQGRHVIGVYPLLATRPAGSSRPTSTRPPGRTTSPPSSRPAARRRAGRRRAVALGQRRPRLVLLRRAGRPRASRGKLGCYLITETMARRHQLSMESYDRLFPNQDTMPRGGFGNLIALPLQHEAAQAAATGLRRRRPRSRTPTSGPTSPRCARIGASHGRGDRRRGHAARGQVVGVRSPKSSDDEDAAPWTRPPSGRRPRAVITEPLPPRSAPSSPSGSSSRRPACPRRCSTRSSGWPPSRTRSSTRSRMRLSTALTPRVIACAEDLPAAHRPAARLPTRARGTAPRVRRHARHRRPAHDGDAARFAFQRRADAPPGAGGAGAPRSTTSASSSHRPASARRSSAPTSWPQRGRSTLVLVHRQPLLDQWIAQLAMFLGIERRRSAGSAAARQGRTAGSTSR